ncbi:FAD-binding protein [Jatrophihabitans sp.]|uniref:FAD-binding protein n=1 Tax=Jatrophihabitans sp. TaxID=1932789 RepID=UPI0030C77BAE|nr:ifcA [Jatrophihabitans sp.]
MSTEIPQLVDAATVTAWSHQVDVLVVGFGMGGGCAAVEAAATGASVLVLERAAVPGGTTVMAGGHFYLGGGTAVQQATGHADSPEEMAKYLTAVSRDPEPEKINAYAAGSVEHFEWLESLGFQFERSYYPEKAVIQPGTQGLMFTGNEKVWPFKTIAQPAPRGHKVPVPGDTQGAKLVIDLLVRRAGELNVAVEYETGATALVVEDGAVVGVTWRRFEETGAIRAKAVVIAAGGFVMNPEMVAEHVPQLAEKPFVLGSTYDDGLGIRLGISAGAETRHMDQAFVTAPIYPPSKLVKGIAVNADGQRFVAEDSYHSRTSAFVLEQPGAVAFLIVDSEHMERPDFPLAPFIDGWETVAEMEEALGIPAGNLQASLDRYNENARSRQDPDFHKASEWLAPQDQGPWAAFDLRLGKALYAGFTIGGLSTSVDGEVRRTDGSAIDGLYAAGACAANIAQDGKGYSSGTQLGEASFFGRRAGRHAGRRAARQAELAR